MAQGKIFIKDDELVIEGVTFTFKTSLPPKASEILIGSTFRDSYEYAKINGYGELWLEAYHQLFPNA